MLLELTFWESTFLKTHKLMYDAETGIVSSKDQGLQAQELPHHSVQAIQFKEDTRIKLVKNEEIPGHCEFDVDGYPEKPVASMEVILEPASLKTSHIAVARTLVMLEKVIKVRLINTSPFSILLLKNTHIATAIPAEKISTVYESNNALLPYDVMTSEPKVHYDYDSNYKTELTMRLQNAWRISGAYNQQQIEKRNCKFNQTVSHGPFEPGDVVYIAKEAIEKGKTKS
ncbi:hypothetical protein GQR58_009744 [Nymphon striatum]|nr:hypothetical protein GQR58_009744 [Nymphon striatum]